MSKNLFLFKYPEGPEGRYIEDTAQKIEEAFITDSILHELGSLEPWAYLEVFEEEDGDAKNNINEIFVRELISAAKKDYNLENVDGEINNFRTICNIYFLIRIKLEKYNTDDRVIIQLG